MLELAVSLAASILAMILIEYFVHRFGQHSPRGPWWQTHAVEHHRDGVNGYEHLNLPWPTLLKVCIIVTPLLMFVSLWAPLAFFVVVVWWRRAWMECHLLAHDLGGNSKLAYALCPWWPAVVRHHRLHHEFAGHNFGAVFCFTDRLFGTQKA